MRAGEFISRRTWTLLLLLATATACGDGTARTAPVVKAGQDIEQVVAESVLVGARAESASSRIVRYDWFLVSSPPSSAATLEGKGQEGQVAELKTGGVPGRYVVGVTARDGDDLVSTPDFVNVTLWPEGSGLKVELGCTTGCTTTGTSALTAVEGATLKLTATPRGEGHVTGWSWTAFVRRDPRDPNTEAVKVTPQGDTAEVVLPQVSRTAVLTVAVDAQVAGSSMRSASLEIQETAEDDPPQISLEWRQPGASSPAAADTLVLPGDALHVTAIVSDPNGDAVTCSFSLPEGLQYVRKEGTDSCHLTLYPLSGGNLEISAKALTELPKAETDAEKLTIAVHAFELESNGADVSAVAVDSQGRILAAGAGGAYQVWVNGQRQEVTGSFSSATAAAIAENGGAGPVLGMLGYGGTGDWARFNLDDAKPENDLTWPQDAPAPNSTYAMAAGSAARVFAATDQGIVAYRAATGLKLWAPAAGGFAPRAIAVGPNPKSTTEGLVWYAVGNEVHYQTGEDVGQWLGTGPGTKVGTVQEPRITALSAGSAALPDLWVGTGPTGASQTGSGLILFKDSVNAATGLPRMNGAEEYFAQEEGITAVAVERDGPYAGDAWVVSGGKLRRVSRAAVNQGGAGRATVALELVDAGGAKVQAVAVGGGAKRTVAAGTDKGLMR